MEGQHRCSVCGALLMADQVFCRSCGHATDEEQVVELRLPGRKTRSSKVGIGCLIVLVFIVGFGGLVMKTYFKNRKRARLMSCLANMRVIEGGIDMWEMDQEGVKARMPSGIVFKPGQVSGPVGKKLVSIYIKKPLKCYKGGTYHWETETRTVSCTKHGTIQYPKP